MRQVDQKLLLQDYRKARARANRFLRDSNPPLSKKGLAKILNLNACAFNQFVNGTIILDTAGEKVPSSDWDGNQDLFYATNWTDRRLARYIERVETECWTLGISHGLNQRIGAETHDEVETLRLDKFWQFLTEIQTAADLHLASALMLWNVCAQEAIDAREHLRPTMSVNALRVLADLVDRKQEGFLCSLRLAETDQRNRLELTLDSVSVLVEGVLTLTEDANNLRHDSKAYECYHKALGYGGYDKFFLGVALDSDEAMDSGIRLMHEAVTTNHHANDGHVANTAAATEYSFEMGNLMSQQWAEELGDLVQHRLEERPNDPACQRLYDMCIPKTKAFWNSMSSKTLLTSVLCFLFVCVFAIRASAQGDPIDLDTNPIGVPKDMMDDRGGGRANPIGAEGSRTRPTPAGPILALPDDPTTKKICIDANSKSEICTTASGVALPGDSNLDGIFDSDDLTLAMVAGEFEDRIAGNSTWSDGDWNLDGEFDTTDIRLAFEANRFVRVSPTSMVSTVPEPSTHALAAVGLLLLLRMRRRIT